MPTPRLTQTLAGAALLLALSGCSLLPPTTPTPEDANANANANADAHPETAFTLQVQAPGPLQELLEHNLELRRYTHLADLQPSELRRLLANADDNVRQLLATQGYFSPDITIESDPGADGTPPTVQVRVQPGAQTEIAQVDIPLAGAAAQAPDAAQRQARLVRNWALPVGQPFTQGAWDSAKANGLRSLQIRSYPTAELQESRADIDPETHRAALHVTYDSGPQYRFGPLQAQGCQRYDCDGARRLARLPTGSEYSEAELLDAQQRLASSGYYDTALLTLDTEHGPPDAAPVIAQLTEAKLHKLVFGVGVSTDSGARLSLDHQYNRLPWLGWRASSKISVDRDTQLASSEWVSLPNDENWRRFGAGQLQRDNYSSYAVNSLQLRGGVSQVSGHIDRNFFLQYDSATPQGSGAPDASGALSANMGWTGRYFDDPNSPTRGYGLGAELGLGSTLRGQRNPFARTRLRWQSFIALGKVAIGADGAQITRNARLALRAEGGAVLASDNADLPTNLLFMTGGDTSVRGYGYRRIGATTDSGGTYGGRYLAVASMEWQRPIAIRGDLTHWESAVFIDAGAVSNQLRQLQAQVGIGAGLRWRSPVGPLQTDLAWGVQDKRLRLHLRLGFSF